MASLCCEVSWAVGELAEHRAGCAGPYLVRSCWLWQRTFERGGSTIRIYDPLRLSGLLALLAGLLLVAAELLTLALNVFSLSLPVFAFNVYGFLGINGYLGVLLAVLMQLGLVGLYASQAKALRVMGLVGFLLAFIGTRFVMNPSFVAPIAKPYLSSGEVFGELWGQLGVLTLCFIVGWVLFGVAVLRAGVYPRPAALLLIAGTLILVLPLPLSSVVFAAAVGWMGYFLFRRSDQEAAGSAQSFREEEYVLMRFDNLLLLCGLAAFLTGVMLFVSEFLRVYLDYVDPGAYTSIFILDAWLGLLLGVLVQLALVGLYAPQAKEAGALGAVGFFIAFVGVWLTMGHSFVDAYAKPSSWVPELLLGEELEEFWGPVVLFTLTYALGWVLFGVAVLRAGVYPRPAALLLIAGTLILVLPLPLGGVIFTVAVTWMGYFLFSRSGEGAVRQTSAS